MRYHDCFARCPVLSRSMSDLSCCTYNQTNMAAIERAWSHTDLHTNNIDMLWNFIQVVIVSPSVPATVTLSDVEQKTYFVGNGELCV